ncbi:efflux RND transporter permease subunit [Oceanobacillus chungangensis]|uniref:Acriflavin resistance protein n=1 Tax=Oceanobacillus chungangensis TaxID=1229152 RepID=A0A3D8PPT4_9BACI|nr:efflux RND transporter permease subunit [Oceanobacillus chungangensis]RDW17268.1 acriflavin resistance protein [Oceanobacillus chungangensis]
MLKSIIRFSMKNGVALLLVVLLMVAGGIYALKEINIEKYPSVDIPYLTIVIPYPGASPGQSMKEIGEPVERELLNLDGVENVYTDGVANAVYATLEFDMSTDMEEAEQTVRASVDKIQLPELAEDPLYFLSGPEPDPTIFSMGIYAEENQGNVQQYVEEEIIPRIEVIEGVSEVIVGGTGDQTVSIRLLPDELKEKGITLEDVKTAISANNLTIPTGDISFGDEVLPVRVSKELESVADVENIQLFTQKITSPTAPPELETVRLGDIANIAYENENTSNITRINGEPGVSFGIIAKGGANTVEIVEQAREEIETIKLPEGYKAEILRDQSIEIEESVYSMLREALLGALMAVVVTLLFLRNIRSTIIAVISIPLSILSSLMLMNALGYTLNIMTLAGIAVAVGRVVDDSIVVIENVFRRVRTSKERDEELVEEATREVASAITSSTITTVAVFLPMAFVPGIVGGFFKPLAWTIVISLLISLVVAITVVPLMSKTFLLKMKPKEHKENTLQKGYRKSLQWVLKHRFVTLTIALVLLVGSVVLIAPGLGTTFLPQEKTNNYDVGITMAKGTSPELTNEAASTVEEILLTSEEVELVNTNVHGENENASISFVVKESVGDVEVFVKDLREKFEKVPDVASISLTGVGGLIGGAENQYALVVNGANSEDIKTASEQIVAKLQEVDGMADVTSSLEGEEPEIEMDLNEDKLADHGLMPAMVGQSLRSLINGDVVTTMTLEENTTDVVLGLKMDEVASLEELGEQEINNVMGIPVALQEIGELKEVNNPTAVSHLNTNEYVMITGLITDSNTGDVAGRVDEAISNLDLPDSVSYYEEGTSEVMADGFRDLGLAIIVSIFLVYLVMVIAFGEGKAPFVILFAIPFSVIGSLLGLFVMQEPIGMPAMIGLLMLNGIVVTNAIVLVDKVQKNEKIGMTKHQALIEAGVVRIRPILMTAIATVGALIPMAISSEAGIVSKSLAVVVIGGLSTSTILTLFIVPVLYSIFNREKKIKVEEEQQLKVM